MARRVVRPQRPSEAAALIGKQIRISERGEGLSVRLWPGTYERLKTPWTRVTQGECIGYEFRTPNAFYLQIAGAGGVDIAEPGTVVELVTPHFLHRVAIYLGLAEAPYCF